MTKYSKQDLNLVLDNYYNSAKIPMTSEYLKSKITEFAKISSGTNNYESLYPYTAIWKINSDCNLRCKHCYFYGSEKYSTKNDLSFDEICNVINQISELGIAEIRLTGGEVFLHKDIFRIIKFIKAKGLSVIITTNGTLITNKLAKDLSKIINPYVDIVRVSLDGATSATHDITRGTGVFEKAINSIKLLKQNNIKVFVPSVITSKNVNELADLYNFLNKIKVNQLTLTKIVPMNFSQNDLIPSFEDLIYNSARMYEQIKDTDFITVDNRLFTSYNFLQDENAKKLLYKFAELNTRKEFNLECHCNPDKSFYIDADGTVYLCPLAADYKVEPLGNLKQESLEELFKKRKKNKLFKKQDRHNKKCKNCKIFSLCNSGCIMKAYLKNGKFESLPC